MDAALLNDGHDQVGPHSRRGDLDPGGYVELHLHTCYSLLEGASQPEELIATAAEQGYRALAITDRNNLYGAMVFARRCREYGIRPIIGAELTVATTPDDPASPRHDLTLLAATRRGYANLCRLTSLANGWGLADEPARQRRRRDPCLAQRALADHAEGLVCLTGGRRGELATRLAAGDPSGAEATLHRWVEWFGTENVWVELHDNLVHGDQPRNRALVRLARRLGVGVVATGDVHYHVRARHRLHDALCAIRHRTTLDESHELRRPNSELFLRSPEEQVRRFAEWPEAVANTVRIAERCRFNLTEDLGYRLPVPAIPTRHSADSYLAQLCHHELVKRYEGSDPELRESARSRLTAELALIERHGLAGFFLVYREVLSLATRVASEVRAGAPRAQANLPPGRGRGSSVSSIVCYLIGLSHVDPITANLPMDRFLNDDMTALPDIDLDFPRDIRDRLFQRVYEKWGTEHAALVATFPRYRIRSAVRDLGKVLALPSAEIDRLAKIAEGYAPAGSVRQEMERAPQFRSLVDAPGWRQLVELAHELDTFPRHLSQHVGGMIIASDPLIDCVPIQPTAWPGRYVCHWDKDDIDDARMVKIDFLALGMLSLVEECLDLCARHRGKVVDLSRIDLEDQAVYDRIGRGDTVGVFQIESRAQAGILPTTKPRNIKDLTAQVAIIRPGPIVGGAIGSYKEHRLHPEITPEVHETIDDVLEETFGVVLYQEQVVQIAMRMGGFTPGEAETFRRAMGRKDWPGHNESHYRRKFLRGARDNGVPREIAERTFTTLTGFAQFGFPKSHAAAFAVLAFQSAWLREYYTTEFYCALFNNWPMGFYPPHVFTNDARRHNVEIRQPAINLSQVACTVEGEAIRLGLKWVRGLGEQAAAAIVGERDRAGPYLSLWDFVQRTGLAGEPVENAIRVGVFDQFGLRRRELLWQLWLFGLSPGSASSSQARVSAARGRQLQLDLFSQDGSGDSGGQDSGHRDGRDSRSDRDQGVLGSVGGRGRNGQLPDLTPYESMATDYEVLGLSPHAHPMQFLRKRLPPGHRSSRQLCATPVGTWVEVAGLIVCRQRPGTARGAVYLLLEDEHGMVNVVLTPNLYDRRRVQVRTSSLLCVRGVLEGHAGDVATVRAHTVHPFEPSAPLPTPDGKSWS